MTQSVGLIGVGLMGHGLARNILKRGFPLTIMNHPGNRPLDELLAAGVQVRDTAAQVAAAVDVAIIAESVLLSTPMSVQLSPPLSVWLSSPMFMHPFTPLSVWLSPPLSVWLSTPLWV